MSELEQKISELTHDLARADGQLRMLGEMARTVASGVDFDMALKRILAVAVEDERLSTPDSPSRSCECRARPGRCPWQKAPPRSTSRHGVEGERQGLTPYR